MVLTLVVAALPLAGIKPESAPILTPVGVEPVPFDTGLRLPSSTPFQPLSLLAPSKLVLGPLPSPALAPDLHSQSRLQVGSPGFRDRDLTYRPSARSPPSA